MNTEYNSQLRSACLFLALFFVLEKGILGNFSYFGDGSLPLRDGNDILQLVSFKKSVKAIKYIV